ncbi:MAG: hypothetical protein JWO03_744 [Bacteroidetes bacterium]|nr:hypothetical protein [Bacteroidota bacterium]
MKSFKYIVVAISLVALISFAVSCKKSQTALPTFEKSDVPPLHTGNWWRYLVTDSINNTTDTLTLTIASSAGTAITQTAKCYITRSGNVVDSGYFLLTDTALTYQGYNVSQSLLGSYKLKLPFTTGGSWSFYFAGDDYHVKSYLVSAHILGNTYTVFDLSRHTIIPDNSTDQHLEIAGGIGLVFEGYTFTGIAGVTQHFGAQLIDYQLN